MIRRLQAQKKGSHELLIQDMYSSYFEKWMFMRVHSIFLSCVYVGQVKMVQKITRQQVEVREATHYVHTHRQKAPKDLLRYGRNTFILCCCIEALKHINF